MAVGGVGVVGFAGKKRETRSSQMGSPEYSSYELKSIVSACILFT